MSMSETSLLRHATLLCAALSLGWLVHAGVRVVPLSPARFGERGRRRERWLAGGGLSRAQDAVVRWVGGLVARVLPDSTRARLARSLVLAGEPWGFGPEEWLAASVCSAVLGWGACFLLRDGLSTLIVWFVVLLCPWLPALRVREERRLRVRAVERSLPIAMDLVALCARAGSDFPAALRFVVRELSAAHPICTHELSRIEEAIALGHTRVDALTAFAARLDSPPVARFVASLVQSERRGIALADALATQAESLRRLRSVKAEESAARAGVRMVVPLMLMLGSILTLLIGPLALELNL